MKRDMELVRKILLAVEASGTVEKPIDLEFEGIDPKIVSYNVSKLYEAGLVSAIKFDLLQGPVWSPMSLTWSGHEFLDAARNETVWQRV